MNSKAKNIKLHENTHIKEPRSPSSSYDESSSEEVEQEFQFPTQKPRIKMISFIDSLYSKFKLLNKLSQEQSNNFQTEIITMLIDEDQFVDSQLYEETVQKIGLGTFVLQVLGGVLQKRNKFKNQYEMNRNLEEIAKELEKQRLQLVGKNKLLEKRELAMKKKQTEIIKLIQEKAVQIQENLKTALLAKQQEAKKRIKVLLTSLKSKQKEITDKQLAFKESLTKLNDFEAKQKSIEEKLKILDKKQKQRKSKQASEKQQLILIEQNNKKQMQTKNQLATLEQTNKKLQEQISKLNKKIKTNEMAYRHTKDQTDKKLLKFNEIVQRLEKQKNQNQKLNEELEKLKNHSQRVQKEISSKENEIERLKKQISNFEKSAIQNTTKPLKQKPQRLIFDELEISKIQDTQKGIQNPGTQTDRNPFDSNEDLSILEHVAESIIVVERRQPNNQLNDLSRTVDIQKQIFNWEKLNESAIQDVEGNQKNANSGSDSESEQEDDSERQRNYVINMKKGKKLTQQSKKKQQPKPKENFAKQSIRQKIAYLKQQQQSSDEQSYEIPRKMDLSQIGSSMYLDQSTSSKKSNIALFDNYFGSENFNKGSKHYETTEKQPAKSPHDVLLSEIKLISQHENEDSCSSLKSLSQESLNSMIMKIGSAEMKHPKTLVEPFLELLLVILQPCTCDSHQKSLANLFSQELVTFLQEVLLKFEAVVKDIEEKSIIILSRILLSYQNHKEQVEATSENEQRFKLKDKYLKSLKVKLLLEKDEFIRSNIKFLMEYE